MVDKVISGTAFIAKMKRYAEKKLVTERNKDKVKASPKKSGYEKSPRS